MLKSVLDMFAEVQTLFALHKPTKLRLVSAINFELLKSLTEFLSPFADATKLFESENKPTLHMVIPKMNKLKQICEASNQDSFTMKAVKKKALEFINSKFKPHVLHKVAVFLNPRQKSMLVLCEEDQTIVLDYVKAKMDLMQVKLKEDSYSINQLIVKEESNIPSSKRAREESNIPPSKKVRYDFDEFDDIEEVPEQLSEILAYQKHKLPQSDDSTLLEYWQANENRFPALSALAKQVFSVMATSSASERVFSHAGYVVSARRSNLSSNSVDSILFINSLLRAKKTRKLVK